MMYDLSALIHAKQERSLSLVQQALEPLQPLVRLTAALFMPSLREVELVVQRLNNFVGQQLPSVPSDDTLSWIRGQLRRLIIQRLEEISKLPHYTNNPFLRLLLSSGHERIKTVPIDVDPVSAINQRVNFMAKGAIDLLRLRFNQKLPFTQIATQRMMSEEDVVMALQTACLQLDWTGDASGAPLEPSDYYVIDQSNCSEMEDSHLSADFTKRLLDDFGFALRSVRAARLHIIAATWCAPAVAVQISVPVPEVKSVSAARTSTRSVIPQPRTTANQLSVAKSGKSSNNRRKTAQRKTGENYDVALDDYPARTSRSSQIITIVSVAVVLSGILALILRYYLPGTSPGASETPNRNVVEPPNTPPIDPAPIIAHTNPTPHKDEIVTPVKQPDPIKVDDKIITSSLPIIPVAAWSTRQLVTGYSGPLLRIRRDNDNKEMDFMATSSGALDTEALQEFVGRDSAYISCWYDQSPNHHDLKQPAHKLQPYIIKNGRLIEKNKRPVIFYNRDRTKHLITPAAISVGNIYAVVTVEPQANATQALMGSLSSHKGPADGFYPIVDRSGKGIAEWWVGLNSGSCVVSAPIKQQSLFVYHGATDGKPKPTLTLRFDGIKVGEKQAGSPAIKPDGPTVVGATYWDNEVVDHFDGNMGEIFVLPVDSSEKEQSDIMANLKNWWHIP